MGGKRALKTLVALAALGGWSAPGGALAEESAFRAGAVIEEYGKVAEIEGRERLPQDAAFRISFDVAKPADPGAVSRALNSGARFLNMHGAAGVPEENMKLAFVIHGRAVYDVTRQDRYGEAVGGENATAPLVAALIEKGVDIYVCGQSAAYYGVKTADLLPGVRMALSAMTAHALLQQEGYTVNPF